MSGFKLNVIAFSPHPNYEFSNKYNVKYFDDPKDVYKYSDIISIHANVKNQTLIGYKELTLMKKTAILINCARNFLVDNKAVYEAVKSRRLFGYGLDSPWPSELPPLDNVNIIVSPHVGSDTDYGKMMMRKMSTDAMVDFISGNKLTYLVN